MVKSGKRCRLIWMVIIASRVLLWRELSCLDSSSLYLERRSGISLRAIGPSLEGEQWRGGVEYKSN